MKLTKSKVDQIIKEETAKLLSEQSEDDKSRWQAQQLAKNPAYRTGRIVPGTKSGEQDIRDRLENLKDIENAMEMLGSERPEDIPTDIAKAAATEIALLAAGGLVTRGLITAFPKVINFLRRSMGGPVGKGALTGPFKTPRMQPYNLPTAAKHTKLAKQIKYPARPNWMSRALYSDIRPLLLQTGKPGTALSTLKRPAINKAFTHQVGGHFAKPQVAPAYLPFSSLADELPSGAEAPGERFETPEFVPQILPSPDMPLADPTRIPRRELDVFPDPPPSQKYYFPPMEFNVPNPQEEEKTKATRGPWPMAPHGLRQLIDPGLRPGRPPSTDWPGRSAPYLVYESLVHRIIKEEMHQLPQAVATIYAGLRKKYDQWVNYQGGAETANDVRQFADEIENDPEIQQEHYSELGPEELQLLANELRRYADQLESGGG